MQENYLNQEDKEKNIKEPKKESLLSYMTMLISAVVLALLIRHFIFSVNEVKGQSMFPTFHDGDRVISLILPLKFHGPNRGDVVIIDSPIEKKKQYIKRIIGLPNDNITLIDGHFYINGEKLEEKYLDEFIYTSADSDSWQLADDEYFVCGDNRPNSSDSRVFGPIKKEHIRGIVSFRFWPISEFGTIGGNDGQ